MRYVSVGRRFVALLIDGIVLVIAAAPFAETSRGPGYFRIEFVGARSAVPFLLWIAYFVVMEATLGATLGKLAMGVRVVMSDGSSLDLGAAFVRNLARLVDGFPYVVSYLLGAIAVWSGPTRQRLGDVWAHSVVVERDSVPAADTYPFAPSGTGTPPWAATSAPGGPPPPAPGSTPGGAPPAAPPMPPPPPAPSG